MHLVKSVIIAMVVTLAATASAAQYTDHPSFITVSYVEDGRSSPCDDLQVELRIEGRIIHPQMIKNGFLSPAAIDQLYKSPESRNKSNVDIHLRCAGQGFDFLQQYPARVLPGSWTVGIANPPFWFDEFKGTNSIERGMWISYLVSECNGCDPGVIISESHSDPPPALIDRLRQEQPTATGVSARDSAYALAIFDVDYTRNRKYLLRLLDWCLTQSGTNPDACDERLLDELANLYWRGDKDLLEPLVQATGSDRNVVDEIGSFLADLLDRSTPDAIRVLHSLPVEKQEAFCKLAGEDGFRFDHSRLERAVNHVRAVGDDVAQRCLQEAEKFAK